VQRAVYATLRLKGFGDAGVLVRETIVLKAGTLIDGRDSQDPGNTQAARKSEKKR